MNEVNITYSIRKELEKWDDKVLFDVRFKEDTKADLNRLNKILDQSLDKFTIIAANSEALVYKIGRHFVSRGVNNSLISFIDGKIIESYIGDNSVEWKKKDRVDEFLEIFGDNLKSKWVLIPLMQFEITTGLALYLMTKFQKIGVIGLIFYAEGPNNITEILCYNTENPDLHEFPIKKNRPRKKRTLPYDEW